MTVRSPWLLALIGVWVLGGCAETPSRWVHPDLSPTQWAHDEAACKRKAKLEAEREIGRDQAYGRGADQDDPFRGKMAVYEAGRRAAQLTAACMTAKGYRSAER